MISYASILSEQDPATVIIPAYNEEKRIGSVLDVLQGVKIAAQIIVVDDGSSDKTVEVVMARRSLDARIELLRLPANRGKGGAMLAGVEASQSDLIVFLDADLIGVRPEHVEALIEPVQAGRSSMALGIFSGGRYRTDLSHKLAPFLSGQRCLRWSLFRDTPDLDTARWGVESALSLYAWRSQYRVIRVPWLGVTHETRPEKIHAFQSYWSHVVMWADIGAYVVKHLIARKEQRVRARLKRLPAVIKSAFG
jgi:glycosyltransferase involved in cell wall biosynthesis